jgi:hypothetical protein
MKEMCLTNFFGPRWCPFNDVSIYEKSKVKKEKESLHESVDDLTFTVKSEVEMQSEWKNV